MIIWRCKVRIRQLPFPPAHFTASNHKSLDFRHLFSTFLRTANLKQIWISATFLNQQWSRTYRMELQVKIFLKIYILKMRWNSSIFRSLSWRHIWRVLGLILQVSICKKSRLKFLVICLGAFNATAIFILWFYLLNSYNIKII